jgi:hypothetical protein
MNSTYKTYTLMVRGTRASGFGSFFLDIVAVSYEAAYADLREAYGPVEVITVRCHDGVILGNRGAY